MSNMTAFEQKVQKIIISKQELDIGIQKAADWINNEYIEKTPVIIGILKGCIPFLGNILPRLKINCVIDFMSVSSFHGGTSASTEPKIDLDLKTDISNKDVLILEDIIDTARTLDKVINLLKKRNPKSIKIVTLLDKQEKRKVNLQADYSCFIIPDIFIIGFGLDYKEKYRNIPYICTFKAEYIDEE